MISKHPYGIDKESNKNVHQKRESNKNEIRALLLSSNDKNLNWRRLRPSQFRKLSWRSFREGVKEEGGEGRWDDGLTSCLCYLTIQSLHSLSGRLLFLFLFCLLFFSPFFPFGWFLIFPKIPWQRSLSRNQWLSKVGMCFLFKSSL